MKLLTIAVLMIVPMFVSRGQDSDGCSGITFNTGTTVKNGPCYDTTTNSGGCSSTAHYIAYCYTGTSDYSTSGPTWMALSGTGVAGKVPAGCYGTSCVAYVKCPNIFSPGTEDGDQLVPAVTRTWLFKASTYDRKLNSSVLNVTPYCQNTSGYHSVAWQCVKRACTACGCAQSCICQSDGNCQCSPVVVDPTGKFAMTDMVHGVRFVVDPGEPSRQMSWPDSKGGAGWLVLPDVNGQVKSFAEMFADYNKLGVFDLESEGGNGNGQIDPGDEIYARLRVWIDSNQDGVSQPEELHTLASIGVGSIGLKVHYTRKRDPQGNWFRYVGDDNKSCDVLVTAEPLKK